MRDPTYTLKHLQALYDFIAANPKCTMIQLCAEFKKPASTIRNFMHRLVDSHQVDVTVGSPERGMHWKKSYEAIAGKRPTEAVPRRPKAIPEDVSGMAQPRALAEVRRTIKPAKQLGMSPYADLPREFFARSAS